jgi:hypothetical protein
MRIILPVLIVTASVLLTSCAEKKTEAPKPEPLPKTFAFTDTNTVTSAKEIEAADSDKRSLKADFNLDGLNDLAIIKDYGEVKNAVDIYIQKKPDAPADNSTPVEEPTFFRGGTIKRPADGQIIGLASSEENNMVNIIILVTYTNRQNEMIHYMNDGKSFTEVDF